MAAESAGRRSEMRDFIRGLFQGSPDLSVLTHVIVRKKYLAHTGQESLTKEEKEQLKLLVEEELIQMKADDSPDSADSSGHEVPVSVKPEGQKRPRCTSSSSGDEVQSKQEQKKQRMRKKLEVSSDEEDSGIDSKKVPLRSTSKCERKSSESSDQLDRAETHVDESGSDGLRPENKGRASHWKSQRESFKGSKTTKQRFVKRQQETSGSESDEDTEEQDSDVLAVIEKHIKASKGKKTELEYDSEWEFEKKKRFGKEHKRTEAKGKDRTQDEQRRKKDDEPEEKSEPSKVGKIPRKKRVDSSESGEEEWDNRNKKGNKRGQRIQKAQEEEEEEPESEDASGSDLELRVKKKMANSERRRESVSAEELGSDSDGSWDKSQMKKGTPKGKTKRPQGKKQSHKSESDSEGSRLSRKGDVKKRQRRDTSGKKEQEEKKQEVEKPKRTVISEDSESGTDEAKGSKRKNQGRQKGRRSEGQSTSETEESEKGKSTFRKETLSSHESESGSDECESKSETGEIGLQKKSTDGSESESNEGEEKVKRGGAEKSQRVSKKDSEADPEDSDSKLAGRKRTPSQLKREKGKPAKKINSKEASYDASVKEEESPSSEDEDNPTSSKQQHQGKGEEHPSIRRLKRYIRECGVHRNYKKLFAGCRSRKAQVEILKKELENLGLKGPPSLAKCKALKQKREEAAEMASLDISNIISTEGRPRRRNVWSLYSKAQEPPSSPEEPTIQRRATDWSHLRGVISSDGESN
nr:HIRA-interacting protein 3 isoform X1 [Pogona vitticeps]XP_020654463.1 HIRA-interacting protein 3 isoform X1 [Pogona vitticeps]